MSIIALIPARDEPAIGLTVDSVLRQSLPVQEVIVVCNNCTDNGETARIAQIHGATVIDLGEIQGKKAGAMNEGVRRIHEVISDAEFILQMDADTILHKHFVRRTTRAMKANARIGGLGANFVAQDKQVVGLLNRFLVWGQKQEFTRFFGSQLAKQTSVLSGTASLLRATALAELEQDRGFVWSETCIVEDYEMTKALQARGWLCMTDASFIAYTDVMTTWKELINQRERWQRGTLEVIFRDYRKQACVKTDRRKQVFTHLMAVPHLTSYPLLISMAVAWGGLRLAPLLAVWTVIGLYNAWTARRAGWKTIALVATIVPLELYNFIRYYWLWRSWKLFFRNGHQAW